MMKKIISFLILLISLLSCHKDTPYEAIPMANLSSLSKDIDGITLAWEPLKVRNFINYQIIRLSSNYPLNYIGPQEIKDKGTIIATLNDPNSTKFSDKNLTYGNYFYYIVQVNFGGKQISYTLSNNFLTFKNDALIFTVISGSYNDSGSQINIDWEKIQSPSFKRYEVYKLDGSDTSITSSDVAKKGTLISSITQKDQTNYTDSEISSVNPYIFYAIKAIDSDNMSYSQNIIKVKNNLVIDFIPEYVLVTPDEAYIILVDKETKKVIKYDISRHRVINTIVLDNTCCRPFIGEFNGNQEIYIPTRNGKILILDLQTFNKVQEINLNTTDYITSVIKKGDVIFYTQSNGSSDLFSSTYGYALSRSSLNQITLSTGSLRKFSFGGGADFYNLKDNYFLAVSLNYGYCDLVEYTINGNNPIFIASKGINSGYSTYNSLGITSDSAYFIFDAYLRKINFDIFTNSSVSECFTYIGTYGNTNGIYSDVCISNTEVYFGLLNKNIIEVFNNANSITSPMRTYTTNYPPLFIRKTNKGLCSLNKINNAVIFQFFN